MRAPLRARCIANWCHAGSPARSVLGRHLGNVPIAIDAVHSAAHPHTFLRHAVRPVLNLLHQGKSRLPCDPAWRSHIDDYDAASIAQACALIEKAGLDQRVMVDCSHANSNKDHTRQAAVCHDIATQITAGERRIIGLMIESNLVGGAQKLQKGKPLLTDRASPTPASVGMRHCLFCVNSATAVRTGRGWLTWRPIQLGAPPSTFFGVVGR